MVSTGLRLNPADRENGLALLGELNGRQKANRKSGGQWVGVRATHGVVESGRWAFCVWNETGGNLRIGWSCAEATLKLGTDRWSFGYGGTATKSNAGQFTKYGQTFGQGDAITCCVDLDRRAITYMKNGREIPGDAFSLKKDLHGYPLFPHVYTKEATFSISFDGRGGAPPLLGGYSWISTAPKGVLVPHPKQPRPGEGLEDADQSRDNSKPGFVLTAYGWRTAAEAGVSASAQEWRGALDSYVKHFTSLLELEYEAEKEAVLERVNKRSPNQLVADGTGIVGLGAEFDRTAGRITLYWEWGAVPYLSEISRGRTVLISSADGGVDVEDASKTISGEVESISSDCIMVVTQYERLPSGRRGRNQHLFRVDLGPNIVAYKRIDSMLDELQRCLGTFQAKTARSSIEKLNQNQNLSGLLLPGTPFANALYADISESSAAASKWDPLQRPKPNPEADISKASREQDVGAAPYEAKGSVPDDNRSIKLNRSQEAAMRLVLERRRRFSLIQGPPGTGKTTTAVSMICGWLRTRRGPVLASAFSNRGTDNLAEVLHNLGVRVLRMGLCPQDRPYSFESRLAECGRQRGGAGLRHVMENIDVVCATCIGCGMGPLDKIRFPFVVIDEAAQVIEPAVILPLGKGAVQAVLVGDQCQLPATVLSQEAQKGGLDISMFDRLLSMGMEVQFLSEQYRMHPQIASFPSWRFYRGELKSAVSESQRQLPRGFVLSSSVALVHVEAREQSRGSSKRNVDEAACAAWLVEQMMKVWGRLKGDEVGVISPYAAQVADIRNVSSVDAFQGCQKDVIILSLVRANPRGDVGFVSDWRRLNVALTRSRKLCVILANLPTWLTAESALLRDWIGFHPAIAAEVKSFQRQGTRASLAPLPPEITEQVTVLRDEFARNRPAAAKLPRVSVAAKGGGTDSATSKRKALEAARALSEAISQLNEEALETALLKASDAGIMNSTVEEAEDTLRRLVSLRELKVAASGDDDSVLQAAIFLAKQADVSEAEIAEAEDSFNQRLKAALAERLQEERQDRALAMLKAAAKGQNISALKQAIEEARAAEIAAGELQAAEETLTALLQEEEIRRMLQQTRSAPAVAPVAPVLPAATPSGAVKREAPEPPKAEELPTGKSLPNVPGLKRMQLRVLDKVGCGMILQPTRWGMVVEEVDEKPGQPLLQVGDCIQEVDKLSLVGLPPDVCEDTFGASFRHGAWLMALSGQEAGVDLNDLDAAEFAYDRFFSKHAMLQAQDEASLRSSIQEARAAGVEAGVLAEAEARLRTLTAERELADAGVLVAALEMAGVAQEEDAATYRAAYEEAREAGVDESKLAEAEDILHRLHEPTQMEMDAAYFNQTFGSLVLQPASLELKVEGTDPSASAETHAFPPLPPIVAVAETEAKRRKAEFNQGNIKEEPVEDPAEAMHKWSMRMIELALLQCRKRKAVELEDFDLAHRLKQREPAATLRLTAARRACLASKTPATKEEIPNTEAEQEDRKRLRNSEDEELQAVKRQKQEAVEKEDFARASELRRRELELERRQRGDDSEAAAAALQLLSSSSPEDLLRSFDPGVADFFSAGAGEDIWEAVSADLKVAAAA